MVIGLVIVPAAGVVVMAQQAESTPVPVAFDAPPEPVTSSAVARPLVVSPSPGPALPPPTREVYTAQIAGYPGGATLWSTVRPGEVGTAVLSISADPWALLAPGGGFGLNGVQFWCTDRGALTEAQWSALFVERPDVPMVIVVADFGGVRNFIHAVQGTLS